MEDNLVKVRNAGTEQDLGIQYKALKPEVDKLNLMAAKRQQVSKKERQSQFMGAEWSGGFNWVGMLSGTWKGASGLVAQNKTAFQPTWEMVSKTMGGRKQEEECLML